MQISTFGGIFADSGIFSYVIVALGLALVALLVAQLARLKERDFSPILWSLIAALFMAGVAGTVLGQLQMFYAATQWQGADLTRKLVKGWGISMGPMAMATPLALLGAVLTGIASYRVRRQQAG